MTKPKTDNTSMGNPPTGTYFEKPKPQTKGWEEKLDKYGCCSGDYCSGDHNAKLAGFIRRIENQAYKRGREDEAIECQKDMEREVKEEKKRFVKQANEVRKILEKEKNTGTGAYDVTTRAGKKRFREMLKELVE